MRRTICIGFYCVGIVTGLVLITLYSLVCVESELERLRRNSFFRKRYLPLKVNLPTTYIYKQGHMEIVKKEENTIFYKNTIEDDILNLSWVNELHQVLIRMNSSLAPQINLVIADGRHVELLLNWLIAALVKLHEPLHNVLVLGMDCEVCELIKPRGLSCIHSNPKTFIRTNAEKDFKFLSVYSAPQTRLLAARLINYWGFSLASYDTDALVLRNPQSLYDRHREMDVIAGAAVHWPEWASAVWGFSMCLGAVMIRNGPATEELWRAVSKSWGEWGSEQDQFNRALANSITWNHTSPNMTQSQFCQHQHGWEGTSRKVPRGHVLLLPPSLFCRGECCDQQRYPLSHDPFIFHGGGGNIGRISGKVDHMKEMGVWFLRGNWREISHSSSAMDARWLKQLSTL